MARCWEQRGCDEEMQAACAHATVMLDECPTKCAFAHCERPQHELTSDPDLIFGSLVDRKAAIKQICYYCAFFLTRGPGAADAGLPEDDTADESAPAAQADI